MSFRNCGVEEWLNKSLKSPFRGPFDKQHGNGDETLLKLEPHHLYHIY